MLIAVSGNIGSGKTTLANHLASRFNLHYVPQPERRLELNFLDEFFKNIEQNFLPAQLSFLITKSIEIQELLQKSKDIVLDRSILEDVFVFARLWIEQRNIEPKIVELYYQSAEFIQNVLPTPDLYLFCRCSPKISRQRISNRNIRSFEKNYPPDYVEILDRYYEEFLQNIDAPCIEIDTEYYDFTDISTLDALCSNIFDKVQNYYHYNQLSLFESNFAFDLNDIGIKTYHFDDIGQNLLRGPERKTLGYIYLAAPFSQMAPSGNDLKNNNDVNLLSDTDSIADYGTLPRKYQNFLTRIEKALTASCHMDVLLPHRDINNWGKNKHSANELTPALIRSVVDASAIVAIPGNSIGVHLELGIAIAQKMPIIIFDVAELSSSFFVTGFSELPFVKYISVEKLSQIPRQIESNDLANFITKML